MTTIELNMLINSNLVLAERIAANKKRNVPSCVRYEELVSAAYLGLVEAAHKFKESRCTLFPVFASFRIRGAIKDYLREIAWGTRQNPVRRDIVTDDMLADYMDEPCELFAKVVGCLSESEQRVVRLHYMAGLRQSQIAKEIGKSKARICQMLKEAAAKMRTAWEVDEQELYEQVA